MKDSAIFIAMCTALKPMDIVCLKNHPIKIGDEVHILDPEIMKADEKEEVAQVMCGDIFLKDRRASGHFKCGEYVWIPSVDALKEESKRWKLKEKAYEDFLRGIWNSFYKPEQWQIFFNENERRLAHLMAMKWGYCWVDGKWVKRAQRP